MAWRGARAPVPTDADRCLPAGARQPEGAALDEVEEKAIRVHGNRRPPSGRIGLAEGIPIDLERSATLPAALAGPFDPGLHSISISRRSSLPGTSSLRPSTPGRTWSLRMVFPYPKGYRHGALALQAEQRPLSGHHSFERRSLSLVRVVRGFRASRVDPCRPGDLPACGHGRWPSWPGDGLDASPESPPRGTQLLPARRGSAHA